MQTTTEKPPAPQRPPIVGGYLWRDELDDLAAIGQELASDLAEMSQLAPTVQATRQYAKLIKLSSQMSIKALQLKNYRIKHEPASTAA